MMENIVADILTTNRNTCRDSFGIFQPDSQEDADLVGTNSCAPQLMGMGMFDSDINLESYIVFSQLFGQQPLFDLGGWACLLFLECIFYYHCQRCSKLSLQGISYSPIKKQNKTMKPIGHRLQQRLVSSLGTHTFKCTYAVLTPVSLQLLLKLMRPSLQYAVLFQSYILIALQTCLQKLFTVFAKYQLK